MKVFIVAGTTPRTDLDNIEYATTSEGKARKMIKELNESDLQEEYHLEILDVGKMYENG